MNLLARGWKRSGSTNTTGQVGPPNRSWTEALCCPICHGELREIRAVENSDGRIKEGQLICDRCQRVMALVSEFKYDFHTEGVEPLDAAGIEVKVVSASCERRIPGNSEELVRSPNWAPCPPHFLFSDGTIRSTCTFSGDFTSARVRMVHHPR